MFVGFMYDTHRLSSAQIRGAIAAFTILNGLALERECARVLNLISPWNVCKYH